MKPWDLDRLSTEDVELRLHVIKQWCEQESRGVDFDV